MQNPDTCDHSETVTHTYIDTITGDLGWETICRKCGALVNED